MEALTATTPVTKNQLIDEQIHHSVLTLVEGTGTRSGKVYARGEFGHSTKPTANGRRYPKKVWEKNIDRLQESLQGRKVLGELDHPSDGRTSLQRASHVITEIHLEDDRVMGEAEILDTSKGRDLKAILAAGVPVGISSRGYGSTHPDGEGIEEVQDDYKLVTFDFVAEPADSTAYPEVFFEGVDVRASSEEGTSVPVEQRMSDVSVEDGMKALDETKAPVESEPSVSITEDARIEELRKELSEQLLSNIASMRAEVEAQVREELKSDPALSGAIEALRKVQEAIQPFSLAEDVRTLLSEKDHEIEALRQQLSEAEVRIESQETLIENLTAAAREAGYRYHMERLLSGHPDDVADAVRDLVPDVTGFESADALSEHVEGALKELLKRNRADRLEAEKHEAKTVALREKNQRLAEQLDRSQQENEALALRVYATQRLQSHPKGARIMRMLESTGFDSEKQIDRVIETYRDPKLDADDLEAVRERVRLKLGSGREHLVEDEALTSRSDRGINSLGMSLNEYKKLSGIERS